MTVTALPHLDVPVHPPPFDDAPAHPMGTMTRVLADGAVRLEVAGSVRVPRCDPQAASVWHAHM